MFIIFLYLFNNMTSNTRISVANIVSLGTSTFLQSCTVSKCVRYSNGLQVAISSKGVPIASAACGANLAPQAADAISTPFYSSDLHFLVFQNRPDRGALICSKILVICQTNLGSIPVKLIFQTYCTPPILQT